MNINIKKQLKRLLNVYNLAILCCVIIVIIALYFVFKPEKMTTPYGIEVIDTKTNKNEEISEEKAKEVAIKQFEKLGEEVIKIEELTVKKIERKGEEYFYITSQNNSLEIKIKGGEIVRINSAAVNE